MSHLTLVKNREGFLVSETERECTNPACRKIFPRTSKTVTLCNQCNSNRVRNCESKEAKMLARAKTRSKLAGIECTITVDDIVIPDKCPIMDITMRSYEGAPGGRPNSPALDRIDNSEGYVPGNVQVICHLANMMKSSATPEELLKFADWAIKTYRKPGKK